MSTGLLLRLISVLAFLTVVMLVGNSTLAQDINYDSELVEIDRQIAEAEEEAAQHEGGLILTMIKLRIEMLKSARAFIELGRYQEAIRRRSKPSLLERSLSDADQAPTLERPKSEEVGVI